MARIVVVGAGIGGQIAALLLAPDHDVVLLERDPAPPPRPRDAWTDWERRGVGQFRLLHYFSPQLRILLEAELPDVVKALDEAGALRLNPILMAPADFTGGTHPGDEHFEALTARRPVYEAALAEVTAATPAIDLRRGTGEAVDGIPHVTGVRTEAGEEVRADDRHRLASMRAACDGVAYEPDDPTWQVTEAMQLASGQDPDVLRGFVSIVAMLALPEEVIARPGLLDKVMALGTGGAGEAGRPPGPSRAEVVALVGV